MADTAARTGVRLSAHAPYFVNLNAHEPEKIWASQQRILQTARISSIFGAESIVFHAGFYLGDPPHDVYNRVKDYLAEIANRLKQENIRLWLRPEVTGKGTQFGTIDEVLNLCTEIEGVAPCIDFAHWHARTGGFNSYAEFASMLRKVKGRLGDNALDKMHIHFAGIHYGQKGEIKHLNLKEADLQYIELLQALKDFNAKGLVVCESPNLEEDALLLQATYNELLKTS